MRARHKRVGQRNEWQRSQSLEQDPLTYEILLRTRHKRFGSPPIHTPPHALTPNILSKYKYFLTSKPTLIGACQHVYNFLLNFVLFLLLAQMPAPVDELQIIPSDTSARVTWVIHEKTVSSLITQYYIYLNGQSQPYIVSRAEDGDQIDIPGLKPYTVYTVGIETVDGALQRSRRVSKTFNTEQAGKDILEPLFSPSQTHPL